MARSSQSDVDMLAERLPVTLGDFRRLEAAISAFFLTTGKTLMANQEQVDRLTAAVEELSGKVDAVPPALTALQESVDGEQQQVADALAELRKPDPNVEAAITKLASANTNLGTISDSIGSIKTDIEGTIPDSEAGPTG